MISFGEAHELVKEMNIDEEQTMCFKAAVLILYCANSGCWNIRKAHKASWGYWFTYNQIREILKRFHDSDVILEYAYLNAEFSDDHSNNLIELTLLAGLGAGEFKRYNLAQ